jgi:hypothetical protein
MEQCLTIRRVFLEELAARLEHPMNEFLRHQPQQTYEDKKSLMRWLHSELDSLNLGIVCPRTSLVGYLAGNKGHHPERGQFRLYVPRSDGTLRVTLCPDQLPPLRFAPRMTREDVRKQWTDVIPADPHRWRR